MIRRTTRSLAALIHTTEEGAGSRWATGWTDARVVSVEDPHQAEAALENDLVLSCCHGQPIRRYEPRASAPPR